MRGAVIYAPGTCASTSAPIRRSSNPTDAIVRITATCVCGSDLWDYRGINPVPNQHRSGTSTAASSKRSAATSTTVTPGQFVIGSFFASDNTCPHCRAGFRPLPARKLIGGLPVRGDPGSDGRRHPGAHTRAARREIWFPAC